MGIIEKFRQSSKELKDTRTLVKCAMFIALYVALKMLRLQIDVDKALFNLEFLAIAFSGALFGPVASIIVGCAGDLLHSLTGTLSGGFNWGFTINNAVSGLLYGLILYKNMSIIRCVIAKFIEIVVISWFMTNIWLVMSFDINAIMPMAISRAPIKLGASLPIEMAIFIILVLVLKPVLQKIEPQRKL
ncbi:MAG: folate family ECF transporter S component [Bacillota bacterium]|nr:folate family ECF transporter S component [Bacillota bacterium]